MPLPIPFLPLLLLLLVQTGWTLLRGADTPADLTVLNGLYLLVLVYSAGMTAYVVAVQRHWVARLFLLALLGQIGGDAWLIVYDIRGQAYPDVSGADLLYLSYYVLVAAALLTLLPQRDLNRGRVAALLDGTIIAATIGILIWERLLGDFLTGLEQYSLSSTLSVAYVALDLLVLGLSVILLRVHQASWTNLLLGAGLLSFVGADLTYLLQGDAYQPGGPLDLLWTQGAVLQTAAVWSMFLLPRREAGPVLRRVRQALELLPFAAVLAVCALLVSTTPHVTPRGHGVVWGTVAVVLLSMLRQWLTIRHNADITRELQQRRQELEYRANHDALTGLPNRTALEQLFATHPALAGGGPYAMFSLDLNGFKAINDTHGHAVGDRMLVHAATQLRQVCGTQAQVFRWGGDEFVVVAPGLRTDAEAGALAHRLEEGVETPLLYAGHILRVGTAVGYALGRGAHSYEMLFSLADSGMYRAKQRSGGRR